MTDMKEIEAALLDMEGSAHDTLDLIQAAALVAEAGTARGLDGQECKAPLTLLQSALRSARDLNQAWKDTWELTR
jgi:hypothetical protein